MTYLRLSLCGSARRWSRDEKGQDLVEYAMIMALLSLACCAGMSSMATAVDHCFSGLGTSVTHVLSPLHHDSTPRDDD